MHIVRSLILLIVFVSSSISLYANWIDDFVKKHQSNDDADHILNYKENASHSGQKQ